MGFTVLEMWFTDFGLCVPACVCVCKGGGGRVNCALLWKGWHYLGGGIDGQIIPSHKAAVWMEADSGPLEIVAEFSLKENHHCGIFPGILC